MKGEGVGAREGRGACRPPARSDTCQEGVRTEGLAGKYFGAVLRKSQLKLMAP